ncbi:MAG: bifunctional [glutamate--ammonia ligase]-adenylyl-L-tyrosine phosphorylase/[glutamate--ammonia-ligase] adenylyltransferase, partial [Gammaproteobacteria bacterium]
HAVPSELHPRIALHWEAWQNACTQADMDVDPGIDLGALGKVWACSDYVAQTSCRYPALWQQLMAEQLLQRDLVLDDYQAELRQLLQDLPLANDVTLMQALRLFRHKHMLRIAVRDLAGMAATADTLRNLTELAESCVDQTLAFIHQEQCSQIGVPMNEQGEQQQLVVLGMGKLGGFELNYSSDIDLIFAFPEEGETRGQRSLANSQFFVRLGQRLIKLLNDKTADGFVFRVDMRLRPYGDSGPLVMSFAGMEHYYQTQGRDWERYAMIKARVIGGDRVAGAELMAMLRPFVYRRYLDFGAFEAIREMKAMIDAEVRRKGTENNIKLGKGGIREIEFIGQTYQLIRGGGEADLQIRSILKVLALLAKKGYLPEQAAVELTASYDFLRRLENRLQMYADGQTHLLPDDSLQQLSMALAMGYAGWSELAEATSKHRQRVHRHFNQVFAIPEQDQSAQQANPYAAIWKSNLNESDLIALLDDLEFPESDEVAHQLCLFRDTALIRSLTGTALQRLDNLMPLLLKRLAVLPRRVGEVLRRLLNLLQAIVRRSVYLALLIEYPVALEQVVKLCAASPWIASLLTRYPILLDELLDTRALYEMVDRDKLKSELDDVLAQVIGDEEGEMEVLRKFKQAQVLKVAAMDVSGNLQVFDVSEDLTAIADVLLCRAYTLAMDHLVKRHGKPGCIIDGQPYEPSMAILAYGKLGGYELGYGSDLDLVFLHDSRGEEQYTNGDKSLDNNTFFARVAQRVVHILSTQTANGRLYEVDTRLRPDGAAGMLVSSLDAFELYQQEKAWTWEHQALIRARMIVGAAHIAEEFARIRRSVLARPRDAVTLQKDVVDMRQKMRDTLGSKEAGKFHLKQDAGGIVDIEFLAQYAVLANAAEHPELLEVTATRQILDVLQTAGIFSNEQVAQLSTAYVEYRARSHQRALQEQSSKLDDSEFLQQRDNIKQIWQAILGQDLNAQV